MNRTAKPTAHSSFKKDFENHEKSKRENLEKTNEILNKQSVNVGIGRKNVHQNYDTDDSEPREFRETSN